MKSQTAGYCRVCGDENGTRFYAAQRQILCPSCAKDTPAKCSRASFDAAYWAGASSDPASPDYVPDSIRAEFYQDYLRSSHTLDEYIARTSSVV